MTREDRQRIGVAALIFGAGLCFALFFRADDGVESAPPVRPTRTSEAMEAMAHWYDVTEDGRYHPWTVEKPDPLVGGAPRVASTPRVEVVDETETPRTFAEPSPERTASDPEPERPRWLTADFSSLDYETSPR